MKKLLLIVGIASMVVCVLFLFFAVLYLFGYYHVVDGSAGLYRRLYQKMIVCFVLGSVFAVIGAVCMILRFKR